MLFLFTAIEDDYNKDKLESLYHQYNKLMLSIAYNILKDSYLAQDVVQSAFIKIIDNLDKIGEIDCNKTRAFIVIICRNLSINLYRKRNRQSAIELESVEYMPHDGSLAIDEVIIDAESFKRITANIKSLHEPYADVLSLKYFYDYSDKEIAGLLDISHTNVRARLHRARLSLIKLLLEDGKR